MKKSLLLALTLLPSLSYALLPPLYESIAAFKSLVNDERLADSLQSGEAIIRIDKGDDFFTIMTNKSTLRVNIVHDRSQLMGPAQFHLEFEKKEIR